MAISRTAIFPYKMLAGRWSPLISAGIELDGVWRPVEFYIDSGAAYTILRAKVADDAGFEYKNGRKVFVQVGDGKLIPVYLHDIAVQIGATQFVAPLGFSAGLGVPFNLLGRSGTFEHFRICFHEKRRVVSFQAVA